MSGNSIDYLTYIYIGVIIFATILFLVVMGPEYIEKFKKNRKH